LVRWVVALWDSTQLALALDATSLGDRFVVLTVSVVYRGCAIPVAWTVLPANQPGAWRREWLRLLRQIQPAMPPDWVTYLRATDKYFRPHPCRLSWGNQPVIRSCNPFSRLHHTRSAYL
jgi:hypothetical protein